MAHYKYKPVVVIPVEKRDSFITKLKKHGYTVELKPVYTKGDNSQKPTIKNYLLEMECDNGQIAAIQLVLQELKKEDKNIKYTYDNKLRGNLKDPKNDTSNRAKDILAKSGLETKEDKYDVAKRNG